MNLLEISRIYMMVQYIPWPYLQSGDAVRWLLFNNADVFSNNLYYHKNLVSINIECHIIDEQLFKLEDDHWWGKTDENWFWLITVILFWFWFNFCCFDWNEFSQYK